MELEDPERISESSPVIETKLENNLGKAVLNYITEQNYKDEIGKLNIQAESTPRPEAIIINNLSLVPVSKRIVACIIDTIICLLITLVYSWFKILPAEIKTNFDNINFELYVELLPYAFKIVVTYFIIWLAMQFTTIATIGGTIGCKFFKIAISNADGFLLGYKHSLLRAMSWSATILTGGLGNLLIFSKKRKPLHDLISKTKVTYLD